MKKNVLLTYEEKGSEKKYKLMFLEFPSGLKFPIKLCKPNSKLMYRIGKELEEMK